MKTLVKNLLLAFVPFFLFSCQADENSTAVSTAVVQMEVADTLQQQRRPAPEFFIIPPGLAKNRVWLCDDGVSDIFHVKNDCPLFMTCNATKRNVSLARAIEEYDRYNCPICSEELSHIFDEEMIRMGN